MTIELVTALAGGIVLIINAAGAVLLALYTLKTREIVQKDVVVKNEKLDTIHTLVNSRLTDALDEIKKLKDYIMKNNGSKKAEEILK